jgi:acetyl-CoA decarbonylase/synthase complex subunit beta
MSFEDIPVDIGIVYEGERIRWPDTHIELGGPRTDHKFELVRTRSMDDIEDGKITIIGPDIKDVEPGTTLPFGILVEVAGKEIEEDLEGVIERRIHEYVNYIQGFMHLNQRYDIHLRLSKSSVNKGMDSFNLVGTVILRLYKMDMPLIEKIQISFLTEAEKVEEMYTEARNVYEARDARARGMRDDEADVFYGCSLCQSFAPSHVCTITPQRYANCGAISWFDGRAASRIDPKGPIFEVVKGECLDDWKGEYTGINEMSNEKTLGAVKRVELYTAFGYPHTSCGCFEAVAFYIPEVDGLGVVDRDFRGKTVNGLPFSIIADTTAGGTQVDGFHGLSIEYMRSPKFLQVDEGWNRVVWLPKKIKERVHDFIPEELVEKISTEEDVSSVEELRTFLDEKEHPIVERWAALAEAEAAVEPEVVGGTSIPAQMFGSLPTVSATMGGFKIILENARIHADKIIIRKIEKQG